MLACLLSFTSIEKFSLSRGDRSIHISTRMRGSLKSERRLAPIVFARRGRTGGSDGSFAIAPCAEVCDLVVSKLMRVVAVVVDRVDWILRVSPPGARRFFGKMLIVGIRGISFGNYVDGSNGWGVPIEMTVSRVIANLCWACSLWIEFLRGKRYSRCSGNGTDAADIYRKWVTISKRRVKNMFHQKLGNFPAQFLDWIIYSFSCQKISLLDRRTTSFYRK